MTLTVLFPRTRPIQLERSVTWGYRCEQDWPFEKECIQAVQKSQAVLSVSGNLSLAACAVCKWVRRSGHDCSNKNLELLKIFMFGGLRSLLSRCRNSTTEQTATRLSAHPLRSCVPSVCVVATDMQSLSDGH